MERIPIGCKNFDDFLGGGIECGSVTLFYGEAGSGKTNICLQTAYNVVKSGKKVVYLDTEGLSFERVDQVFQDKSLVGNLLVFHVHSFEEQSDRIAKAVRLSEANDKIGLIVIDSLTMFYRLNSDDVSSRNELAKETEQLLRAARKNEVPVIITSQVYTNIGSGTLEFLGGHALHHNAKTIIRLDKKNNGRRAAVIMKHRSLPEGRSVNYRIVSSGIEDD
ncbi:MAG: DNA repair and recombination protein RadB [Candidatus Methanomethylophilaceae archaeon]|nr:DNA repair and recombination protein RadB [Candidatus Methanomethylophilaceae archaeon]